MNHAASPSPQTAPLAEALEAHHAGCWGFALSCCRFDRAEAEAGQAHNSSEVSA